MADTLNGNVKAFLQVIRHCEGTAGPNGYRTLFGGSLFDDYSRHPNIAKKFTLKGKELTSTAAGAYQFLYSTWSNLVKQYKFPDFSPESQDKGAIALIKGRKALADVEAGNFEQALYKCNKEWASLPGSPYGQPVKTIAYCKQIYEKFGGVYMVAPLVPLVASVASPFLEAAFKELLKDIPALAKMFGSGSEVSDRNIKAVEMAVEVVKEAVGANTEQEAVVSVRNDTDARAAADQALRLRSLEITGLDLSGVGEARAADTKRVESGLAFWKSPAFWVTAMLIPLLYRTVEHVMTGTLSNGFTGEMKASIASAVVSGILGGAIGFWLGASFTTSTTRGLGATPK